MQSITKINKLFRNLKEEPNFPYLKSWPMQSNTKINNLFWHLKEEPNFPYLESRPKLKERNPNDDFRVVKSQINTNGETVRMDLKMILPRTKK